MDKISVIVPCFNEEENIFSFFDALQKEVVTLPVQMEYIFVDDGSTDRTLELIKELCVDNPDVRFVSFTRNFGKEAAILAGLKSATGDYVSLMDVDLQDPPHILKVMYETIQQKDCDCVASRRVTRKGEPIIRSRFSQMFYRLFNITSPIEIMDGARDFRLMKRSMVDSILALPEHVRFSKGLFSWVGYKTEWISYDNVERFAGKTKWSFGKLFLYSLDGLTDYSNIFLIALLVLSAVLAVCGVVLCILSLVLSWNVAWVVFSLVTLLFSIVFFSMAIMTNYLTKILLETKDRPDYLIKEQNF